MASPSFNPIHLSHPVAIKLTTNNFLSWQSQITHVLDRHGLLKFLEYSPPNQFLHPTYLSQINPAYASWSIQDQLILCWLRLSLSDTILGQVASCTTSHELWASLQLITSASLPSIPSPSLRSVTSPSALDTNPRPNNSGTEYRPNTNGYRPNGNRYRPANGAQTFRHNVSTTGHFGRRYAQQPRPEPSLSSPFNPNPPYPRGFTNQTMHVHQIRSTASFNSNAPVEICQVWNKRGHTAKQCRYRYDPRYGDSNPTLSLSPQQPTPTLPLPPPKSLSKLLKEHDLPPGLFPKNITGYKFDVNTSKITVNMPGNFDNFDVHGLRFSNTVTGSLEKGRLNDIIGIQTVSLTWEDVHCIKIKSVKGKSHFHLTGKVDKLRCFNEFESLKDGIFNSF